MPFIGEQGHPGEAALEMEAREGAYSPLSTLRRFTGVGMSGRRKRLSPRYVEPSKDSLLKSSHFPPVPDSA